MHKSSINKRIIIPPNNKSAEIPQPRKKSFDFPAAFVSSQGSSVLHRRFFPIPSMGANQVDTHFQKSDPKRVTIVSSISNNPIRETHGYLVERFNGQFAFVWRGRENLVSHRKTLAVCHHHKLCSFSLFGFSDTRPPFFAGAKVASIKHSLQSIWPASSSSAMKARQIFNQVPSSSHCFNRRQQVDGLGYSLGRAFHGAPVQRIQRMPSRHPREGRKLGPPFFDRFGRGMNGAIFPHCPSDSSSFRVFIKSSRTFYYPKGRESTIGKLIIHEN